MKAYLRRINQKLNAILVRYFDVIKPFYLNNYYFLDVIFRFLVFCETKLLVAVNKGSALENNCYDKNSMNGDYMLKKLAAADILLMFKRHGSFRVIYG